MGQTKRYLEQEVKKKCTCGVGCSFELSLHSKDCKAREIIKKYLGDFE